MLHSGCVKRNQKFRDFVGLPMGLLREGSPKTRMNTGLFGSRSGEYGLMVGRTPEYLGKKIEAKEVVLTIAGLLIPAATILTMSAVSCLTEAGQAGISNPGPHGLSEILYGFASGVGNNGSAFAGLGANSLWYNVLIGLAMLIGRFAVIVPVLAIAGNMATKKIAPANAGTFNTGSSLFAVLLAGVVLIVGALTFLPALALGPIVDQLFMLQGKVF